MLAETLRECLERTRSRAGRRDDPCEAFADYRFNGIERKGVAPTAAWILASDFRRE